LLMLKWRSSSLLGREVLLLADWWWSELSRRYWNG